VVTDAALLERRALVEQAMTAAPSAPGILTSELHADGFAGVVCQPDEQTPATVLYFHGGGYRLGSAAAWRAFGTYLALSCQARVLLADYRLAPEQPFPSAVEDALAGYRWLLDSGTQPGSIVIGGDSAGGGLAVATAVGARDTGLPQPAGLLGLSPWFDLTNRGESFIRNAELDPTFTKQLADSAAQMYLQGRDARTPLASPLFADLAGLPEVLIHVGEFETLLDDAQRFAQLADAAGVAADVHVWPGKGHVFHLGAPADVQAMHALDSIGGFVNRVAA
jgi:epsilon-lactone hydrolase